MPNRKKNARPIVKYNNFKVQNLQNKHTTQLITILNTLYYKERVKKNLKTIFKLTNNKWKSNLLYGVSSIGLLVHYGI